MWCRVWALWCVVASLVGLAAGARWSRQVPDSMVAQGDGDWVPLSAPPQRRSDLAMAPPTKRQTAAQARILAEPFPGFSRPEPFPPRAFPPAPPRQQLFLQSLPAVPSAPMNYLTEQGFGGARFPLAPSFAPSQGFAAPQYSFDPPPPQRPITFDAYQKPSLPLSPQAKPFAQTKNKYEAPKFVDGYRAENSSAHHKKKPQSLQKIKYDSFERPGSQGSQGGQGGQGGQAKVEREEVQLLYVPADTLNRGQFNFRNSPSSAHIGSDIFSQGLPKQIPQQQPFASQQQLELGQTFAQQQRQASQQSYLQHQSPPQTFASEFRRPSPGDALHSGHGSPADSHFGQDYLTNFNAPATPPSSPAPQFPPRAAPPAAAAPRPAKLKPHQPPLAVFVAHDNKRGGVKVGDVLAILKSAKSVAVLDSVGGGAEAPRVFIGPAALTPPKSFAKFELPYLSSLEPSAAKLRQLPFFVAPLSYSAPGGFAKIPFPAPHVGSVIVNAQPSEPERVHVVKPTPTTAAPPSADVIPNSYAVPKKEASHVTQKPTFSYYSTGAPRTSAPANAASTYYSIEPQTVSTVRPDAPHRSRPGAYFLSSGQQYEEQPQFVSFPNTQGQTSFDLRPPAAGSHESRPDAPTTTSTQPPTRATTTKSSTYPSQLLETHNPYSINQAFHLSTPLDYHSYFDESHVTPLVPPASPANTQKDEQTEKTKYHSFQTEKPAYQQQSSPNYLQNYSPEIQYESEVPNSRFPIYNADEYTTKSEATPNVSSPSNVFDTQAPVKETYTPEAVREIYSSEGNLQSTQVPEVYNQYNVLDYSEQTVEPSTSTSTTTTHRPTRVRGRPRYTTTPRSEGDETNTRTVTRRPLRERKPVTGRTRYEPNRITTERARKPVDSGEATTRTAWTRPDTRPDSRTRGRVSFKPDSEEIDQPKTSTKKEADLAYQRDVLHQNYPVTLTERMSTVDADAATEPVPRTSSTRHADAVTEQNNFESGYSSEQANTQRGGPTKEVEGPTYSRTSAEHTDTSYVPRLPTTRAEEYTFHSRETSTDVSEQRQTTPLSRVAESVAYSTQPPAPSTAPGPRYAMYDNTEKSEELTSTKPEIEITRINNQYSVSRERDQTSEELPTTTQQYNRVRARPGVRPASGEPATGSSPARTELKRRQPPQAQPVTYRPAYDRRRTTMRIDEIEADLKTKQVRARPEVSEHRHPVYKPEPTTEAAVSAEVTSKRGQFKRRRPTYTTTSTEASVTKKATYEVKNRFRGRRPTEKTSDKSEVTEAAAPAAARVAPLARHTRPRPAERYHARTQDRQEEDQDANYSVNRPHYATPDDGAKHWSPKVSADTFKPYNPNDILEERKVATTERRSSLELEDTLDIITARNEDEHVLVAVTPATNQLNKIPTALVEQSASTPGGTPSTFESMLEQVMRSLEEQDEDEYSRSVAKRRGGEIGHIPPDVTAPAADVTAADSDVTATDSDVTAAPGDSDITTRAQLTDEATPATQVESERKTRRRGFWKKVNVRPLHKQVSEPGDAHTGGEAAVDADPTPPTGAEGIDTAESQYSWRTVNQLGEPVAKGAGPRAQHRVTTYKPTLQFIKQLFEDEFSPELFRKEPKQTTIAPTIHTTDASPREVDLGTGAPPLGTTSEQSTAADRSDAFSFMEYLFGTTGSDDAMNDAQRDLPPHPTTTPYPTTLAALTEAIANASTTESSYIPDEITTASGSYDDEEGTTEFGEIKRLNVAQTSLDESNAVDGSRATVDSSSMDPGSVVSSSTSSYMDPSSVVSSSTSSYMDPSSVVSTSVSTVVSHETEICFRGKCIKTSKQLL